MSNDFRSLAFIVGLALVANTGLANDVDDLIAHGKLLVQDNFDRSEEDEAQEQPGHGWTTNSASRAGGAKQVDLRDGALSIVTSPQADHAAVVKHNGAFQDGVLRLRVKLHDSKGVSLNFNDPECKSSHAGHISQVKVRPGQVALEDGKTGVFDLQIRARKEAGAPRDELQKLLAGKSAAFDTKLSLNDWHEVTLVVQGDRLGVLIDGREIGSLRSEGIAHPHKQNFAVSVPGSAEVDDVQIWSLDQQRAAVGK